MMPITNNIAVRPLISAREADKMIWTFIYHGNHSHREKMKGVSKHPIEKWFTSNKEPIPKLVTKCRAYFDYSVPFVENFIGGTHFYSIEGGGNIALLKNGNNAPEIELEGSGTIGVDYESKFESACRARDEAISRASSEDLHTAIIKGIASIESYVLHRVDIWNQSAISDTQLIDNKRTKITFEEKIKSWIPSISNGKKLNLGGVMWSDFLFLQSIRDNDAVHAKKYAQGITYVDLAIVLNKFKTGLADFLLQLHIIFDEPIPRAIIRARFFPEVYVSQRLK